MTPFLADIRRRAASVRRRIAFPESADARTLEAIVELQREELVECVVLGDPAVCDELDRLGGRGDRIELISPGSPLRAQVIEHLLQRRAPRGLGTADAETLLDDPL